MKNDRVQFIMDIKIPLLYNVFQNINYISRLIEKEKLYNFIQHKQIKSIRYDSTCKYLLWIYLKLDVHIYLYYSKTFKKHIKTIRQVLQRLREHGLTAKIAKCRFALPSIQYLGFIVDGNSITPQEKKPALFLCKFFASLD